MKCNVVFYTFRCLLLGVQASVQAGQGVSITGKASNLFIGKSIDSKYNYMFVEIWQAD